VLCNQVLNDGGKKNSSFLIFPTRMHVIVDPQQPHPRELYAQFDAYRIIQACPFPSSLNVT
jgi:hypothetical protein